MNICKTAIFKQHRLGVNACKTGRRNRQISNASAMLFVVLLVLIFVLATTGEMPVYPSAKYIVVLALAIACAPLPFIFFFSYSRENTLKDLVEIDVFKLADAFGMSIDNLCEMKVIEVRKEGRLIMLNLAEKMLHSPRLRVAQIRPNRECEEALYKLHNLLAQFWLIESDGVEGVIAEAKRRISA